MSRLADPALPILLRRDQGRARSIRARRGRARTRTFADRDAREPGRDVVDDGVVAAAEGRAIGSRKRGWGRGNSNSIPSGLGSRRPWQAAEPGREGARAGMGCPSPKRSEYVPKAAPYRPGLALGGRGRPPSPGEKEREQRWVALLRSGVSMSRRQLHTPPGLALGGRGRPLHWFAQARVGTGGRLLRSGVSMSRRQLHTLRAWLSAAVAGRRALCAVGTGETERRGRRPPVRKLSARGAPEERRHRAEEGSDR